MMQTEVERLARLEEKLDGLVKLLESLRDEWRVQASQCPQHSNRIGILENDVKQLRVEVEQLWQRIWWPIYAAGAAIVTGTIGYFFTQRIGGK